ncbi:MAG TPA: hypothetical protein VGP13_04025 [Candidatus Paceibacterota bacterium]|jgi:hypothetical protein|nr:hypothetical protein [Candidatus Paceibacterota bacterium]
MTEDEWKVKLEPTLKASSRGATALEISRLARLESSATDAVNALLELMMFADPHLTKGRVQWLWDNLLSQLPLDAPHLNVLERFVSAEQVSHNPIETDAAALLGELVAAKTKELAAAD